MTKRDNYQAHEQQLAQHIGLAVRRLRQWADLSQQELAAKASSSQTTISDIERGRDMSLRTLARVTSALGWTLSELIKLAEDMSDPKAIREQVGSFVRSLRLLQ